MDVNEAHKGYYLGNVRERMVLVADWLGWQDEELSVGLKSMADAEKMYLAAIGGDLSEMADEWEPKQRINLIGYDPMLQQNYVFVDEEVANVINVYDAHGSIEPAYFVDRGSAEVEARRLAGLLDCEWGANYND